MSQTPDPGHDARSLRATFGICIALGGVILAPVPVVGPLLSGLGVWLCWTGRNAEWATATRVCFWTNTVAMLIGLVTTVWWIIKYS
jgi:hypothetical protein